MATPTPKTTTPVPEAQQDWKGIAQEVRSFIAKTNPNFLDDPAPIPNASALSEQELGRAVQERQALFTTRQESLDLGDRLDIALQREQEENEKHNKGQKDAIRRINEIAEKVENNPNMGEEERQNTLSTLLSVSEPLLKAKSCDDQTAEALDSYHEKLRGISASADEHISGQDVLDLLAVQVAKLTYHGSLNDCMDAPSSAGVKDARGENTEERQR